MTLNCVFTELQSVRCSSMAAVQRCGSGSLSPKWMPPIPLFMHMSFLYQAIETVLPFLSVWAGLVICLTNRMRRK